MSRPYEQIAAPLLELPGAVAALAVDAPAWRAGRDELAGEIVRRLSGHGNVRVVRRPSGRPVIEPPETGYGVSLAARCGYMVVGYSCSGRVGVDLELDPSDHLEPARLASDHFSHGEASRIAALPAAAGRDLFLRLWVAKEACLKAVGIGLIEGLKCPDLSSATGELGRDGAVARSPHDRGMLAVSVRRLQLCAGRTGYCALATI